MENELLGLTEVAALLELSPQAISSRRLRDPLFPNPVAELAATPVWERWQIGEYARQRTANFYEREGVERLAGAA